MIMKPFLIREPKTNELQEALTVLYRSFGRRTQYPIKHSYSKYQLAPK